jgi:hypothetical protein
MEDSRIAYETRRLLATVSMPLARIVDPDWLQWHPTEQGRSKSMCWLTRQTSFGLHRETCQFEGVGERVLGVLLAYQKIQDAVLLALSNAFV